MTDPAAIPASKSTRPLGWLALAAAAVIVRIAAPFAVGLLLGALLGFTLQPLYGRLRRRGCAAAPAALGCALGTTTLASVVVATVATLLVTRGVRVADALPGLVGPGGAIRMFVERHLEALAELHVDLSTLSAKVEEQAMALGSHAAQAGANAVGATFNALITVFFMTLTMYAVLRHWDPIVRRCEELLPFEVAHTHALLDQFRTVGSQVLRGTVVTGVAQGLLASLVYWICGLPDPAFFGVLTGVASLIPAVGTLLVWIPAALYLFAIGHVGHGILALILGLLAIIVLPDYVLRPRLVGQADGAPAILTFVALFGGVEVFGLVGLLLGPIVVTLSVAVLRTYHAGRVRSASGAEAGGGGP